MYIQVLQNLKTYLIDLRNVTKGKEHLSVKCFNSVEREISNSIFVFLCMLVQLLKVSISARNCS